MIKILTKIVTVMQLALLDVLLGVTLFVNFSKLWTTLKSAPQMEIIAVTVNLVIVTAAFAVCVAITWDEL